MSKELEIWNIQPNRWVETKDRRNICRMSKESTLDDEALLLSAPLMLRGLKSALVMLDQIAKATKTEKALRSSVSFLMLMKLVSVAENDSKNVDLYNKAILFTQAEIAKRGKDEKK